MPAERLAFVIVGGIFVILGILSVIWGYREEDNYYQAISRRFDVREFFERWPLRPQPAALKAGGWIAIAVGLGLVGAYVYWWANP
ncbi:MAG: hypothetical protein HY668_00815 [Chloroflexi bacterium]|nr:hypothetical protein [Chloroflexota bacterium]